MKPSAAPEISLHRHDAELYQVESRFSQADRDTDIHLSQGELPLIHLDREALQRLTYDPAARPAPLPCETWMQTKGKRAPASLPDVT